ncbi:MAG TPA: sigma-70 family RNA polymerase sigma factor [Candidatus Dormibacteraeota bacterium]|jgi:RNA polymerase sigma-70 factor (ECF subfamily)|nr:sigma-70 family RNA polymerase sigma factor [Candidatus Dormibacteraeota bacterium]
MDEALNALLACDLDAGFERMVRTHQDRIYGLALSLTGNTRDAEEVAQDAFVRAHRALAGYAPERIRELKLRAWLHRIALNVVRNRVRVRRVVTQPLDGAAELADTAATTPEGAALRRESAEEMRLLVLSLPAAYRDAVVLRHVQQLSYVEAAEVLGRPVGTVKANVHRGVGMLRLALEGQRVALQAKEVG